MNDFFLGFAKSIETHDLIYDRVVGDGDSSVISTIWKRKPYGDLKVEKIECVNHLLVRGRKHLEKLVKPSPDWGLESRKALKSVIPNIFLGIRAAGAHYRAESMDEDVKVIQLRRDIRNAPAHYLGHHENCS